MDPSYRRVAKKLDVDWRTVKRWVERQASSGSLKQKPGQGRKCMVDESTSRQAVDMLLSNKFTGAKHVAQELHKAGRTSRVLHPTTVTRHAKKVGDVDGTEIMAKFGKPVKELTPTNKAKRVKFCKDNVRRNWANVMITDRKKFLFKYPGVSVKPCTWVRRGEMRKCPQVNNPSHVNMYAGITQYGVTKPHFVAGTTGMTTTFTSQAGRLARNITINEYENVVATTLLPEGARIFGTQGISQWVLQQDNDPTHNKGSLRAVDKYKKQFKNAPQILPNWPPNSPDLSPIENAWGIVQARLDARGCKTFAEFKDALREEWAKLEKSTYTNLMRSLKGRVSKCIEMEGEKIGY